MWPVVPSESVFSAKGIIWFTLLYRIMWVYEHTAYSYARTPRITSNIFSQLCQHPNQQEFSDVLRFKVKVFGGLWFQSTWKNTGYLQWFGFYISPRFRVGLQGGEVLHTAILPVHVSTALELPRRLSRVLRANGCLPVLIQLFLFHSNYLKLGVHLWTLNLS